MQTDLEKAWANVEAAGRAMKTPTGTYEWDSTDDEARDASDAHLLQHCDDVETYYRVISAADFRESVLFYIAIRRNGEGIDPQDYADALASIEG